MSAPWGHKITISIYVEDQDVMSTRAAEIATKAAEAALRETYGLRVDFAGASVEAVAEQPYDQGSSTQPPTSRDSG